jgi:hypothetical protein
MTMPAVRPPYGPEATRLSVVRLEVGRRCPGSRAPEVCRTVFRISALPPSPALGTCQNFLRVALGEPNPLRLASYSPTHKI